MKRTDPQFKLRIPPDLKAQIEESAKEHGRSMNAEIVEQLRVLYGIKEMLMKINSEEETITPSPEEVIRSRLAELKMHTAQIELIRQDIERYLEKESQ